MSYLRGPDRQQVQLLPPSVEEYVGAEAAVRFIDAFIEGLDLGALGFGRAQAASTGRPPYHPADLLKLYVYGYLQRIRSSRRLEAEAGRNLELMWLLRGLRPDFKTIADFRKDNRAAFKPLFKQFNLLCRKLDLFGAELVAIDGSKFKAVNNSRRYYSQEQLAKLTERVEARIEEYLGQLDECDSQAQGVSGPASRQELEEKIARLRERKGDYDQLITDLKQADQKVVALTDPDARLMKGPHGYVVGYNVQLAVDAKHGLIVAPEVTNAAVDTAQLAPMALAAKEQLGVDTFKATADKGYHHTDQLQACEQAGVQTFVPQALDPSKPSPVYPKARFRYDAGTDTYQCPQGQVLRRPARPSKNADRVLYYYNPTACARCAVRGQCTRGEHRMIARLPNESVMEANAQRVRAHPQIVVERKIIIEHVFGTLRNWGHDEFLMRGLQKVRAEFNLSALVYNLRRVLNLLPMEKLLQALKLA